MVRANVTEGGKVIIRQMVNKAIKFYFCSTDTEFEKEFCFLGHLGGTSDIVRLKWDF